MKIYNPLLFLLLSAFILPCFPQQPQELTLDDCLREQECAGSDMSCVNDAFRTGDAVSFNCTVNATTHGWQRSNDSSRISILNSDGFREDSIGSISFSLVSTDPLVSSVQTTLTDNLQGVQLTCVDANQPNTNINQAVSSVLPEPVQ